MSQNSELYPIIFEPILKEKVWGGDKLKLLFHKKKDGNIGESWEISGVDKSISIVQNGSLKGKNIHQLIEEYKGELLGEKVYNTFGNTFPLLFKFIDAKEDLSVQLHPNDALAKERHNSFGKTEMWYILDAEEDGKLVLGFKRKMKESIYKKYLTDNILSEILHSEKVKKGDAFFIQTGTVHAIGKGVVLAEIQQTSDITYRIFDYNRLGINGELRELHTDLAIEAINFNAPNAKLSYSEEKNNLVELCKNEYFQINKLVLTNKLEKDLSDIDSFVVYMCVEGDGVIEANNFYKTINKGETILIPAQINELKIKSNSATFLEVYIP